MAQLYDLMIIGGGPAGYTAALYAARADLKTVVFEQMAAGGQMALTGEIDNYPGFEAGVDGLTLGLKMQQGAERFGVETVLAEVTNAQLSGKLKTVETTAGTFTAGAVILAAGANPRTLGLPREQEFTGRGVHYCAHCDGRFYKDKTVLVVGGGNSAAADALFLARMAKQVILVHRRQTLRAAKMEQQALAQAENVTFCLNHTVAGLLGETRITGACLQEVQTKAQTTVLCDGIFISIGRTPATALFKDQLQTADNGYIIADETTKTTLPGVFAAGDIRTKPLRQIVTAVADGATAAHFAAEYLAEQGLAEAEPAAPGQ